MGAPGFTTLRPTKSWIGCWQWRRFLISRATRCCHWRKCRIQVDWELHERTASYHCGRNRPGGRLPAVRLWTRDEERLGGIRFERHCGSDYRTRGGAAGLGEFPHTFARRTTAIGADRKRRLLGRAAKG